MDPRPSRSASVLEAVSVWFCAAEPEMETDPVGASLTGATLNVRTLAEELVSFPPLMIPPSS